MKLFWISWDSFDSLSLTTTFKIMRQILMLDFSQIKFQLFRLLVLLSWSEVIEDFGDLLFKFDGVLWGQELAELSDDVPVRNNGQSLDERGDIHEGAHGFGAHNCGEGVFLKKLVELFISLVKRNFAAVVLVGVVDLEDSPDSGERNKFSTVGEHCHDGDCDGVENESEEFVDVRRRDLILHVNGDRLDLVADHLEKILKHDVFLNLLIINHDWIGPEKVKGKRRGSSC